MTEPRPERPSVQWWEHAVVYQVYPRSFQDTTGNGVGDLDGITRRMDYLAETLGVDAIWLSPFYPSPMADFGYDVSDYRDVDPLFGDLAAFDRMLHAAHDSGLKVLVDFVANHTSDQHPWFVNARSSPEHPDRHRYVWRDPKPDGSPPNNWVSVFGGSAWEWDDASGQYYLHTFLKEQPDLNWRNEIVRESMFDVMRFWLDRGVDGFRIDAVPFLMKDPEERDNPLNDAAPAGHKDMGAYDRFVHVHDRCHDDLHGLLRAMRTLLDGYDPPRMALGEIHAFDFEDLASWYGDLDEVHMPSNFMLLKAEWTAEGIREVIAGMERYLPAGAWPNYVLGNHDDRRLASRIGDAGCREAAVLLLTLRGSPTLYYGDEVGMLEAEIPAERIQDPWGKTEPGLSRDGCRTPMQWEPGPGAGFSTAANTWLPVGPDAARRNVHVQLADPDSLLALYRRLLDFRRQSGALRRGRLDLVAPESEACLCYTRSAGPDRVFVAANLSDEPATVGCPVPQGLVRVGTGRGREGHQAGREIELAPHEAVVVG